jgi:hypothetical protein
MADNKKRLDQINEALKDTTLTQAEQNKLLKENNQLLQEQLDKQRKSYDLSSSMVDSLKEALGINTKRSTADANLLKINKEINKTIQDQVKGGYDTNDLSKQIIKNNKVIEKSKVTIASLEARVGVEGKKRVNNLNSELGQIKSKEKLLQEELSKTAEMGGIDLDRVASLQKQIQSHDANVDSMMKGMTATEKQLTFTKANQKALKEQNKEREKELEKIHEIDRNLRTFGSLMKGLSKIPVIGKFVDAENILKKARKAADDAGGGIAGGFIGATAGAKELGKNLGKALGPAAILVTLIDTFTQVDKQSAEFAKNQGISYDASLQLRAEMSEIAKSSDDVAVNSARMVEAQTSLNSFFGSSVKFSGEMAADFASLSKRTNMTAETQGVIALETMRTGKSAKDVTKEINLQVLQSNKQLGLQMSTKQVQDAIGKTSKALQLTFKGNVTELTKQVMQARALGATMEQVEAISSSLLDFESSIQAELEAELLLGKDINLEKARQAALQGDSAKVAEEVLKNTAIMNAFETKNVIAQEAAAKALGMNRDQLAEMVMEQQKLESLRKFGAEDMNAAQEKYNELRESGMTAEQAAKEVGDDALASQLESLGASEKFEETMARVQELFVQLVPPIMELIGPVVDILLPAIQAIGFVIGSITEGIKMFVKGLKEGSAGAIVLAGALGLVALPLIISAISGIFSTFAQIPFGIGIPLAIAAIAGFNTQLNKGKAKAPKPTGDMFSPADGKTQVSTKEGGLFELSPNDDLVAAPGAGDAITANGGGASNSALISEIQTLIGINRQILAKSPVIEMSGTKVGEGVSQAERAIQ